jgi:hypothetical protein
MSDKQIPHYPNVIEVTSPGNWQVKAAFGTALIIGLVILGFLFYWQVGAVILALGGLAARRLWISIERQKAINSADGQLLKAEVGQAKEGLEITRAERRQAEAAARRDEAEARAAELDLKRAAIGVRLHHFPKVGLLYFHNDGSYDLLRERRSLTAKDEAAQLAAENPEPEFRPQLIQVMSQPGVVYVIAGAQRSGKSWQAGHIADYWLNRGIAPTVIGSKVDNPGYDWAGCNRIITDDKAEMENALRAVMAESAARQHLLKSKRTPAPVILDDWIATLTLVKKTAYEFMGLVGTTMASSGLVVYILMQSDTVGAFGLKDLGAMLKRNFVRLTIIPIPDPGGIVTPGNSRGELVYPNTNEPVPVDLIGGRPACFPDPAAQPGPVIEAQAAPPIPLSPEDRIRAALTEDPKMSISKLQVLAWGRKGGKEYETRKAIIDRIRQEIDVS